MVASDPQLLFFTSSQCGARWRPRALAFSTGEDGATSSKGQSYVLTKCIRVPPPHEVDLGVGESALCCVRSRSVPETVGIISVCVQVAEF